MNNLKTKKCKNCKELFFPNHPTTKKCPWCIAKPKKLKLTRKCSIFDCNETVGKHGSHGYCQRHYSKLIRWPQQKIKLAQKYGGYKICETFSKCKIIFKNKKKVGGQQKYCENCR